MSDGATWRIFGCYGLLRSASNKEALPGQAELDGIYCSGNDAS